MTKKKREHRFSIINVIVSVTLCCSVISAQLVPGCIPDGRITPGDGKDNDCDGKIDEEYCYNGIDEDNDGRFNEDCARLDYCERRGSTAGREFVGAFMENMPDRPLYPNLELVVARAIVSNANPPRPPIFVRIQTPLLQAGDEGYFRADSVIQRADQAAKFFLPIELQADRSRIVDKGFYVRTNFSTSVYGFNKEHYTSDAFLQFPADSLGTEYYAVTYEPSLPYPELAVVALYTDTVVAITFLADLGDTDVPRFQIQWENQTYSNGDTLRVVLKPFQVLQLQTNFDFTGTRIRSNYPVAFYSGNRRTWIRDDAQEGHIGSRDHLVDQLPPVDSWGTRFVTQSYPPHKGIDQVRIVASQPDTIVQIYVSPGNDGQAEEALQAITLPRAGISYQLLLQPRQRASIVASKPVQVVHLTHSQMADVVPTDEFTDPSLIYVVPVNQYDDDYFFGTTDYVGSGTFVQYVVLSVKEGDEGSILFDGQPVSNLPNVQWRSVSIRGDPNEGESGRVRYLQTFFVIEDGFHRLQSTSATFGAVQWAIGDRNTVGYPLGIRWKKNDCMVCRQVICGDSVDNDCDGKIDEEICGDNMDNDNDGLLDEDCSCISGQINVRSTTTTTPRPTTTTRRTTTTRTTTTTEAPFEPPGVCIVPNQEVACEPQNFISDNSPPATGKVNLIFVIDWTTTRLPGGADFNQTARFLKSAITNWFRDIPTKFGLVSFANGVTNFLQSLTSNRASAVAAVDRNYRSSLITNVQSDMQAALRFVRSHMFTAAANADADAKKIVVALGFASYSNAALVNAVKWETTMLANDHQADTYFVGLNTNRADFVRMAAARTKLTAVENFGAIPALGEPRSPLVQSLGVIAPGDITTSAAPTCAVPSPFRSAQICFGSTANLQCPSRRSLIIVSSNFGRVNYFDEQTCGRRNSLACDAANPACPYVDFYATLRSLCNNQQSCAIRLGEALISQVQGQFPPTCDLQSTYLDVSYICVDATDPQACTFTPASRLLGPSAEFSLSASSSATCPSCDGSGSDAGTCDANQFCSSFVDDCRPRLATFDRSALEAWCPNLNDKSRPWLTADLGAPYVVLGVVLQGRRRYLSQYASEVAIYTSSDNSNFRRVVQARTSSTSFAANSNSTQQTWIYFESSTIVARYIKVEVLNAAEHPALHLEVLIHNKVSGCDQFRGANTDLFGKRGTMGTDVTVRCADGTRTADGEDTYTTRCTMRARWAVEKSCN